MRNGSLVFVLVIVTSMLCCAQGSLKVHLKSGEVLSAYSIKLVPFRSLGRAHARLNNDIWRDRILIDSVDHIEGKDESNKSVYYKPLRIQGSLVWTTRLFASDRISIYHARINHFKKTAYNYFYYTKDGGRAMRVSMKNVASDVADDPDAMLFIKKAKVAKGISTSASIVGGGLIVIGMFNFSSDDLAHPIAADDRAPGAFVGGVAFLSLPFFTRGSWQGNLGALENYGR
ncbi:MAG: hypothetical protein WDO15_12000 [Bacteroidota bacterium]